MSPKLELEYLEFHFIDPLLLEEGVQAATILVIGALIQGSYAGISGTPQVISSVVNYNIVDLSHTPAGTQS